MRNYVFGLLATAIALHGHQAHADIDKRQFVISVRKSGVVIARLHPPWGSQVKTTPGDPIKFSKDGRTVEKARFEITLPDSSTPLILEADEVTIEQQTVTPDRQRWKSALEAALVRDQECRLQPRREAASPCEGVDEANRDLLDSIIAAHGWPGRYLVGEKAETAAFLIAQHAGLDDQVRYLPLVDHAVRQGEAPVSQSALLTDRILISCGENQIYGTQLYVDAKGEFKPFPIRHPEGLDERRQSAGLSPLGIYIESVKATQRPAASATPPTATSEIFPAAQQPPVVPPDATGSPAAPNPGRAH